MQYPFESIQTICLHRLSAHFYEDSSLFFFSFFLFGIQPLRWCQINFILEKPVINSCPPPKGYLRLELCNPENEAGECTPQKMCNSLRILSQFSTSWLCIAMEDECSCETVVGAVTSGDGKSFGVLINCHNCSCRNFLSPASLKVNRTGHLCQN